MPYTALRSSVDLAAHLQVGETREDDFLDFKGARPYASRSRDDDRAECARDIAQFANALGGVIVIGATETNAVLTGFESVPEPDDLRGWIERVASDQLRPVPVFDMQEIDTPLGHRVVTVNISPHPTLVARYHEKRYQFVVRIGTSKHYLEMNELEARMQGRERLMRFRLEQIPLTAQVGLDARVRDLGHNDWRIAGVTQDVVRLTRGGSELVAPLAYVEAVYRAEEPNAEWIIRLPCFIAMSKRTQRLHLTKELPHGMRPETFDARGLS